MDKLTKAQRAEIKKMSDKRLSTKLSQVGVPAVTLSAMDREAMLEAWADCVWTDYQEMLADNQASGTAEGEEFGDGEDIAESGHEEEGVKPDISVRSPMLGYDVALERMKLDFELMKFEKEREDKRVKFEREMEEKKA